MILCRPIFWKNFVVLASKLFTLQFSWKTANYPIVDEKRPITKMGNSGLLIKTKSVRGRVLRRIQRPSDNWKRKQAVLHSDDLGNCSYCILSGEWAESGVGWVKSLIDKYSYVTENAMRLFYLVRARFPSESYVRCLARRNLKWFKRSLAQLTFGEIHY